MFDSITDGHAKRKEQYLRDDEERRAKEDITNRPPVIKRAEDEDELGYDIDRGTDYWPQYVYDP